MKISSATLEVISAVLGLMLGERKLSNNLLKTLCSLECPQSTICSDKWIYSNAESRFSDESCSVYHLDSQANPPVATVVRAADFLTDVLSKRACQTCLCYVYVISCKCILKPLRARALGQSGYCIPSGQSRSLNVRHSYSVKCYLR